MSIGPQQQVVDVVDVWGFTRWIITIFELLTHLVTCYDSLLGLNQSNVL